MDKNNTTVAINTAEAGREGEWTEEQIREAFLNTLKSPFGRVRNRNGQDGFHGAKEAIMPTAIGPDGSIEALHDAKGILGHRVNNVLSHPALSVGVLTFKAKGIGRAGSAAAAMNDVIVTAAHNLHTGGAWHTDFRFYPAFPDLKDAAGKRKSWGTLRAIVPKKWVDYGGADGGPADGYDFGMLLADRSMAELAPQGLVWNLPVAGRRWDAYGYPIESPYSLIDGYERMYLASGDYMNGSASEGSEIRMSKNDFTYGASGGPWFTVWNGKSYINSVNSELNGVGPYFGSLVFDLLRDLKP